MAVTVQQIYRLSLSKCFEKEDADADFKYFFPMLLYTSMLEALDAENSIRVQTGRPKLLADDIKLFDGVTEDTIEFDTRIAAIALPYGIASHYFADDMDTFRSVEYRNRFIDALSESSRATYADIVQYGGTEE